MKKIENLSDAFVIATNNNNNIIKIIINDTKDVSVKYENLLLSSQKILLNLQKKILKKEM